MIMLEKRVKLMEKDVSCRFAKDVKILTSGISLLNYVEINVMKYEYLADNLDSLTCLT